MWAAARGRGRPRHAHPRRRGRSVLEGLHLPQGLDPRRPARGSRPAAPPPRAPRRRACRGELGRGVCRDRAAADGPRERARHGRRGRVHRQPERAQLRQHARDPAARQGAAHEERLLGLDRRPDAEACRLRAHLRPPARDPRARHRPHRPPRCCSAPTRSNRTAAWRPHRTGPAGSRRSGAAVAGSSSSTRAGRGRPSTPTCTCRSAPERTRRCSRASPARSSPRASPTRARWPNASRGSTLVEVGGGRLHARARRVVHRRAGRHRALARPRARSGADGGGLRPDRHPHDRVRDARCLARRRAQRPHREPRPARRRDVPHAAHEQQRRPPRAFKTGRWHSRVRGLPETLERAPRGDARRRDGDAGRGAGAGAADDRRQPGPDDPGRRPPRGPAGRARARDLRRPLSQRHHPPRRRDPAAALGAREVPLRPCVHGPVGA